MGSQFPLMRRRAPQSLFSWGPELLSTALVVSPTQDAIVDRAADYAAAAIEMRKAAKNRAHFDNCRAQGIAFEPLIVEMRSLKI